MAEGVSGDEVLELDVALGLLEKSGAWTVIEKFIRDEQERIFRIGMRDKEKPPVWYDGYITALDLLRDLPSRNRLIAEEVKVRREAVQNRPATLTELMGLDVSIGEVSQ